MKSIVFLAQKGGSGKTTLAVNLAACAEETGEQVAIVDTDPQGSATAWVKVRQAPSPTIASKIAPAELSRTRKLALDGGYTLLVVDTAPHAAPEAEHAVSVADLVIIPCRPTAFDLATVRSTVAIVKALKKPGVFVLNACPARAPEVAEAQEALKFYDLPVAPLIGERRAFSRAIATGRAVTEFEKNGKAASEVRELWGWLKRSLSGGN